MVTLTECAHNLQRKLLHQVCAALLRIWYLLELTVAAVALQQYLHVSQAAVPRGRVMRHR